ncbi:retron St85 family effector protein [Pantoea sp. V108_6]|uniref:retron St85 family effector protein n=1 Tax=Pantoea sp. V108_6 TaxID=3044235 RepID=UPI00063930E6|nr:retron St85 family effector protein [Pantoea sp. V108_6]KKW52471.1 UDP-3-O-(3-hydroxymyristoyl) glucosamine N-acyltransferase [Pantoea ananatis]MDI3365053.1 retron St85 family effector protein [Pantoea sp. V108_6]
MILNNIYDTEFKAIGESIRKIIKEGTDDSKKIIFICGKDKSDISSYRYKISTILSNEKNYQLAYPEDLFEDLLEGQANNSLLKLEEQLAQAVDLIILIPESPGSFAELGAFSMRKELAQKMLVLRQGKYKSDKSFINHGPIRLIREYKGHVQDLPNDFDIKNSLHVSSVIRKVKKLIPSGRKKKNIDNILLFQHYILLFIYLFDEVEMHIITNLLSVIFERKLKNDDYIASKAALHSLIRTSMIEKSNNVYVIRSKGFENILERYYAINDINEIRIKIMNKQLSRQISYTKR